MKLSDNTITSFQKLYQEKHGVKIDFEEAGVVALEELRRFAIIYKPIQIKDLDIFNKFNSEKNIN